MEKVTAKELARVLKEKELAPTIKEAEVLVRGMFDTIVEILKDGKEVSLHGFGTFYMKDVEERTGRNPKTGEEITIPAHKAPKFKFTPSVKSELR